MNRFRQWTQRVLGRRADPTPVTNQEAQHARLARAVDLERAGYDDDVWHWRDQAQQFERAWRRNPPRGPAPRSNPGGAAHP